MDKPENEEELPETSPDVNVISELPGKSYGVTMEVPLFLTLLSVSLSGAAISNIILYRTCVHALNHTEDECRFFLSPEKTNRTSDLEVDVQKYATFISTVKMVLESVGPAILSFFLGVWSDTHGRKPLVVWPLLGVSISSLSMMICDLCYGMLDGFGPRWFLVTSIPCSFTYWRLHRAIYAWCYLTDVSTEDNRSFRMTLFQTSIVSGSVIGSLASSYKSNRKSNCGAKYDGLENIENYFKGFTLSSFLTVIYSMFGSLGPWWYIMTAIPYAVTGGFTVLFTGAFCYLSDITSTENRSLRMTILEAAVSVGSVLGSVLSSYILKLIGNVYLLLIAAMLNTLAYAFTNIRLKESLTGAVQGGITTVLDFLLVKEMMRECFKRRPNNGRAQILLLTIANSTSIFILYGLVSLEYLYTREKLHWALKEYTIYSAVNTSIGFVGAFLGVCLFQKVLGVSDLVFSIVAFLSSTAEYLIKAFAVSSWQMYFGASITLFKGLSAPLIRSLITKILPVEDIAKVFSLMCALEGICPLFSPAIFNSLYALTITRFPGAIYVLSASITGCCVVMLGFVQYYRYRATATNMHTPLET